MRGWFAAGTSAGLSAGEVVPVQILGRELVLFRDEAGAPCLLDAHCAHLGAHLGHGGRVEDGCVVCPFHAWRWRPDGSCAGIPYARKLPPRARLGSYPAREQHGLIWGWLDGEPDAPPPEHQPAGSWRLDRSVASPAASLIETLAPGSREVAPGYLVARQAEDELFVAVTPVDERRSRLRAGASSPALLDRFAARLAAWEQACASR